MKRYVMNIHDRREDHVPMKAYPGKSANTWEVYLIQKKTSKEERV